MCSLATGHLRVSEGSYRLTFRYAHRDPIIITPISRQRCHHQPMRQIDWADFERLKKLRHCESLVRYRTLYGSYGFSLDDLMVIGSVFSIRLAGDNVRSSSLRFTGTDKQDS